MRKKIVCALISVILALSLAAGCGGSGSGGPEGSDKEQDGGAGGAPEKDTEEGGTSDDAEDMGLADGGTGEESRDSEDAGQGGQEGSGAEEISFESFTAVENDECSIIVKGLNPDGFFGYKVNVELENKSADKTYRFSIADASVNGVQTVPVFSAQVAPGKKALDDISLLDSTLEDNDIGRFTDIEITFRVYDDDNWLSDNVAKETVHIYPYGEDKAEQFVREAKDTDIVLVDNDAVTAVVTGYGMNEIWGYGAELFLVNKTDSETMFSVSESSVNGYMSDPFWASSVSAGRCAFSTMRWSKSSLEELGITDPENEIEVIEFVLKARNNEDFMADPYFEESVTLEK